MTKWVTSAVLLAVGVSAAAACGGGKKEATEPDEVAEGEEGGDSSDESGGDEAMPRPEVTDELNHFFDRKRPVVARCYGEALADGKLDKKAKGRITVEVTISAGGKATAVSSTQDTLRSPEVASCVFETIKGWDLPEPGAQLIYSFSYDFEPE